MIKPGLLLLVFGLLAATKTLLKRDEKIDIDTGKKKQI
jgi:hypothetical protein